ncbi:MAG TPA: NUDIX hydrolase [Syntrophales bacterium]|jgi:ADP-ribose pyrophosphatase|nr:NUDIX hydrolase [Syntrophales bacterium]HON22522.1 NUDIX hydrolase [Syntrophales bacterium]HOU76914.1 NUDIX hydrolase [Syntrophales bacterium]HPC31683.1 NUDIX hydrolase [Syntrophales bacterium]HQG34262.1 NUDIX hydrolase [Syntrophales bacterium]
MPVVYTCRIFKVLEEEVALPNGHRTRLSWIDHQPCIAVVPRDGKGNFLLIRQYRHATGDYLLEIPAGSVDGGETPEDCVQRELREETGFRAGRITKLFAGFLLPGYGNEYMHFYLAEELTAAPLPPDADEDIAVVAVSPAEVRRMLADGAIRDVKTALGLTLALQR